MTDAPANLPSHFLFASSLFAERKPTIVQTVLGSCVSVCLYDKYSAFGGINHYMLPVWKGSGLASPKYGNIAIEKLLERMIRLGANEKNLIAKVFGGASQYEKMASYGIAQQNVQLAEDMLKDYRIPIIAANTGGDTGRKILYNTGTGQVLMKFISKI